MAETHPLVDRGGSVITLVIGRDIVDRSRPCPKRGVRMTRCQPAAGTEVYRGRSKPPVEDENLDGRPVEDSCLAKRSLSYS